MFITLRKVQLYSKCLKEEIKYLKAECLTTVCLSSYDKTFLNFTYRLRYKRIPFVIEESM